LIGKFKQSRRILHVIQNSLDRTAGDYCLGTTGQPGVQGENQHPVGFEPAISGPDKKLLRKQWRRLCRKQGKIKENTMKSGVFTVAVAAFITVLCVGVLSVGAFSLGKYEKAKVNNGAVTIAVAKLADGKAHFYKLEEGGKEISFFAVKATDGSYKTAFDACDACYKSKKGYEQAGDKMNCKNCNQKFAIDRLGPNATGGCNPGYLPHQLSGATITIKAADIKNGARYF
jgi:uncharacterized membrane protein